MARSSGVTAREVNTSGDSSDFLGDVGLPLGGIGFEFIK